MIKVIAQFFIKEGEVENALALAKELVAETRKEKGCINYELYQSSRQATHIVFLEEWESQSVVDTHFRMPHFTDLVPKIQALTSQDAIITAFDKVM